MVTGMHLVGSQVLWVPLEVNTQAFPLPGFYHKLRPT